MTARTRAPLSAVRWAVSSELVLSASSSTSSTGRNAISLEARKSVPRTRMVALDRWTWRNVRTAMVGACFSRTRRVLHLPSLFPTPHTHTHLNFCHDVAEQALCVLLEFDCLFWPHSTTDHVILFKFDSLSIQEQSATFYSSWKFDSLSFPCISLCENQQ